MLISTAQLEAVNTNVMSGYEDALDAHVDETWKKLVNTGTYGAAGAMPNFMGDVSDLIEFGATRQVKHFKENGFRLTGKVYETTGEISVVSIRDGIVTTQTEIGRKFARKAAAHPGQAVFGLLKRNAVSLYDSKPLFAQDHPEVFDVTVDAQTGEAIETVVSTASNDIVAGPGEAGAFSWYVAADYPIGDFLIREGEDYQIEMPGLDRPSDYTFDTDKVKVGLRVRFICEAGLWFTVVRSNKVLNAENLQEAIDLLHSFKSDKGALLNMQAKYLVVPQIGGKAAADKVVGAALVNGGDTNTLNGALEIISSRVLN